MNVSDMYMAYIYVHSVMCESRVQNKPNQLKLNYHCLFWIVLKISCINMEHIIYV